MRIVVNHVTRMKGDHICVAGIDEETHEHVRPVAEDGSPLTRSLLRENGGPFAVGALVDIGKVKRTPSPPHTEDHKFEPAKAGYVEQLGGRNYLELLDAVSSKSLAGAFGPPLRRAKWTYAAAHGTGRRSLAVVRGHRRPALAIDRKYGQSLQLQFNDVDPPAFLPVTDVRFFKADDNAILRDVVGHVARRLATGVDVYLMLGLTRAYKGREDDRERHWLQVNGLCLADHPFGRAP
ncbi:MAG: hypothetical protein ABSG64_10895 [Solirubrobacteraceae bacterium]|jgi:hypothetical protein